MLRVAIKMLTSDRTRYLGVVLGVALAALVIVQQGAIFTGFMKMTFTTVNEIPQADLWVMDARTESVEDMSRLTDTSLERVRGIEGVAWAMPLVRAQARVRMSDGRFRDAVIFGVDEMTFTGAPQVMVEGRVEDLRRADGVIVDALTARMYLRQPVEEGDGASKGSPQGAAAATRPLRVGDVLELNDRRAVVVGISADSRTLFARAQLWTTISRAKSFVPRERKQLTFVLAKLAQGAEPEAVRSRIVGSTGLAAYTSQQFKMLTVRWFMSRSPAVYVFGFTVLLGVLIGGVITGVMFYNFTLENLKYFGTLKALGASDALLSRMLLVQSMTVGIIGLGLGLGGATLFGRAAQGTILPFLMSWQLVAMAGAMVVMICTLAATVCLRRIIAVEPAIVFKN